MSFVFSRLHESLQQVLVQRLAWQELREVQERTYAAVSAGNDTLVLAPTAGGKSEAALIPVLDDILKNGRTGIACLYIAPLKALINDQESRFSAFCTPTSLSVARWHGDVPRGSRSWGDGDPPHFLMITPESLEVLFQEPRLVPALSQVRYVIIDELHAFVETERGVHLKVLLGRLDTLAGRKIQRIGLSATTGNPDQVLRWLSDGRAKEMLVAVPSEPREKQFRFIVEPDFGKRADAVAGIAAGKKALVFVNSRSTAERLARSLEGRVGNLHIHHSSLSPSVRSEAEEAFASGTGACIICTSTLELGIDIGDLDIVIQFDPPASVSSFLQRMGRSGRRGAAAKVAWILQSPFDLLCSCAIIECAMEKETEDLRPLTRPYPVMLQQIFLLLHTSRTVSRKQIERELLAYPAFSGITGQDLKKILSHLVLEGYLTADGDLLMPGARAEQEFGRSNWKELYSVIRGREEYRTVTPDGDFIGMVDARFIRSGQRNGMTLGGRSWSVVKQDEEHNLMVVVPGDSGDSGASRIFWSGNGDTGGCSPLICKRIRKMRANGHSILPLALPEEREMLDGALREIPDVVGDEGLFVSEDTTQRGRETTVCSLRGSLFNRILSVLLRAELGETVTVQYDDISVRVRSGRKTGTGGAARVGSALEHIRSFTRARIENALPLPEQDGEKYARLLPPSLYREMIHADYYRIDEFMETFRDIRVF